MASAPRDETWEDTITCPSCGEDFVPADFRFGFDACCYCGVQVTWMARADGLGGAYPDRVREVRT